MNFQALLTDLKALGYTQTAIAKRCGCSIPAINDLISGKSHMPSYRLGSNIIELHSEAQKKAKRQAERATREKA